MSIVSCILLVVTYRLFNVPTISSRPVNVNYACPHPFAGMGCSPLSCAGNPNPSPPKLLLLQRTGNDGLQRTEWVKDSSGFVVSGPGCL